MKKGGALIIGLILILLIVIGTAGYFFLNRSGKINLPAQNKIEEPGNAAVNSRFGELSNSDKTIDEELNSLVLEDDSEEFADLEKEAGNF